MSNTDDEMLYVLSKDFVENSLLTVDEDNTDGRLKKLVKKSSFKKLRRQAKFMIHQNILVEIKKSEFDTFIKDYMGEEEYERAKEKVKEQPAAGEDQGSD